MHLAKRRPQAYPALEEPHLGLSLGQGSIRTSVTEGKETVIVFNNCGHGFLDLAAYENYLAGKLEDLDLAQGKIDAALGDLPKA